MNKRLIAALIFFAYTVLLVKVMVFKDMPTVRIGHLMLNFAGTDGGHPPNFVPFTTIVPYLLGHNGLIIAGANIVGNIAPLVPIGFLAMLVYQGMTWKKSVLLAVASGLFLEVMQTVLQVGIFDIDDVILNALGVMIGFWAFVMLSKWIHEKKYANIVIAVILCIAAAVGAFYAIYPWGKPIVEPETGASDLCGGTGGNGQVLSIGNNSFTMKRNDQSSQIVTLSPQATIKTSAGPASLSALKIGDRVTLVGGPNPDGSFTADTVVLCKS